LSRKRSATLVAAVNSSGLTHDLQVGVFAG
jgi:hypothetical protein